jgi:hypothetical protein
LLEHDFGNVAQEMTLHGLPEHGDANVSIDLGKGSQQGVFGIRHYDTHVRDSVTT